jgi:hypothetical protein
MRISDQLAELDRLGAHLTIQRWPVDEELAAQSRCVSGSDRRAR